jgi:C1A family cysteine protease
MTKNNARGDKMYTSTAEPRQKNMKRNRLSMLLVPVILITLFFLSPPSLVSAGQADQSRAAAVSGAAWQIEFALDQADRQKLVETASRNDSGLAEKGISLSSAHGDNGSFNPVFTGTGADQLRAVLFGNVVSHAGIPGGPFTIKMTGNVVKDQLITIVLEANPSTGYSWEMARTYASKFEEQGPHKFEGGGGRQGGSVKQRIVLKALANGTSMVKFVYRRPFEPDEKAVANITLNMTDMPETLDLSDPSKSAAATPLRKKTTAAPTRASLKLLDVPSDYSDWTYFDWRERGGVTKIKDQKTCGSCWAFATVGALESSLRRTYGLEYDLSEQFLVSCNTDGMSCAGGDWAHDYHLSADITSAAKLGDLQVKYGAVLEKDMPYKAKDLECKAVEKHPVWVESWTLITDAATTLTADQIKELIYEKGPIAVGICAGTGFSKYKGGVFETDDSAECLNESGTNHAVLLVGWDDLTQTWILRNSWGTKWGEKGYMNIRWGTSNVAQDISYVEFPKLNCSYKVNPESKTVPYSGAVISVGVTASTLCPPPEATSSDVTVTVQSSTWNDLKGTIKLKIDKNETSFTKTFGVTIGRPLEYVNGSSILKVKQGFTPCKITSSSVDAVAGTFTVNITPNDCEWIATGLPYYWVHVTGEGVTQTGTRTLSYTLDPNTTGKARSGKVTVTLGQNSKRAYLTINQPK